MRARTTLIALALAALLLTGCGAMIGGPMRTLRIAPDRPADMYVRGYDSVPYSSFSPSPPNHWGHIPEAHHLSMKTRDYWGRLVMLLTDEHVAILRISRGRAIVLRRHGESTDTIAIEGSEAWVRINENHWFARSELDPPGTYIDAIIEGSVKPGMPTLHAELAWGKPPPNLISASSGTWGATETWRYPINSSLRKSKTLVFRDGILQTIYDW